MSILEINCETGVETVRPLTAEEITQWNADQSRAEAERAEKDAKDALESSERNALAAWIAGHPDLPEAARNALARATGVSANTGALAGTGGFSGTSVISENGVPNG